MYLVYVLIVLETHRDAMLIFQKRADITLMYNTFYVFVRSLTRLRMRVQLKIVFLGVYRRLSRIHVMFPCRER